MTCSQDISVGTATRWRVLLPAWVSHNVQTYSGAQPASYPMGTGCSFPGCKAAGAWSWPLHPVSRSRRVEVYLHCSLRLRGFVLNHLNTEKILPLPFWRWRVRMWAWIPAVLTEVVYGFLQSLQVNCRNSASCWTTTVSFSNSFCWVCFWALCSPWYW
jgi:hypothetical protein